MAIATKKYKEAIVYLCDQLGGEIRGKKKLAKLLYYMDFDHYEKNHKSITGDIYKALPMGPFPTAMSTNFLASPPSAGMIQIRFS